jgi:hypothetical protein
MSWPHASYLVQPRSKIAPPCFTSSRLHHPAFYVGRSVGVTCIGGLCLLAFSFDVRLPLSVRALSCVICVRLRTIRFERIPIPTLPTFGQPSRGCSPKFVLWQSEEMSERTLLCTSLCWILTFYLNGQLVFSGYPPWCPTEVRLRQYVTAKKEADHWDFFNPQWSGECFCFMGIWKWV